MNKVKVTVLKRFMDKYDNTVRYEVGDEREFESERAKDLIARGLAVPIEDPCPDSKDTFKMENVGAVEKPKQKKKQ